MGKIKGISRIDSEKKKMHGWYVRVYGGGKTFSKYFSDHRHESKSHGLAAAKEHLAKLTQEIREQFVDYSPRQNQPKYRRKPGSANTSGVVGVHKCETVSRGKHVTYWVATWNEDGKRKDKTFYFGEKSRSEEEAKRLAIEWRARKMLELSGKSAEALEKEIQNGHASSGQKKRRTAAQKNDLLTSWVAGLVIKEWSPSMSVGKENNQREVKKRERFNEKRVEDLKTFLGLAAEHFEWDKIDYNFGRGVFKRDVRSRCFWTNEGIRTDVIVGEDGRIVIHQGMKPDEYYLQKKEENTSEKA